MSEETKNTEGAKTGTARSDEQLMEGFVAGDGDAFTELFARYKQAIFGFFVRRLPDGGQAEEFMQETFVAVLRGARRYEQRALFRTYLYAHRVEDFAGTPAAGGVSRNVFRRMEAGQGCGGARGNRGGRCAAAGALAGHAFA